MDLCVIYRYPFIQLFTDRCIMLIMLVIDRMEIYSNATLQQKWVCV